MLTIFYFILLQAVALQVGASLPCGMIPRAETCEAVSSFFCALNNCSEEINLNHSVRRLERSRLLEISFIR